MSSPTLNDIREDDGKLPSWAWPGGYPIIYLTKENEVLCPDCANKQEQDEELMGYIDPVITWDIFYEGPSEFCAECNKEIESAYGDPWVEEENDGD